MTDDFNPTATEWITTAEAAELTGCASSASSVD
jgi:hypothetical protein